MESFDDTKKRVIKEMEHPDYWKKVARTNREETNHWMKQYGKVVNENTFLKETVNSQKAFLMIAGIIIVLFMVQYIFC